jgi:hypothetical protein
MADVSSIAQALAYACAELVFPDGLSAPSVTGRQTVVRRGWLLPSDLFTAQSVRNNVDYVTVTSSLKHYRPHPEPLGRPWREAAFIAPTVSVTVSGSTATVALQAGAVPVGVVGVRATPDDGEPVVASYAVQADDTVETIAEGLASALPEVAVSGGSMSIKGRIEAQVAGFGRSIRVTRRQTQGFTVSIWTSNAGARDALGSALDEALASLGWLSTMDGAQALLTFEGAGDVDTMQTQALYRRDLTYSVTFDTLQTQISAQMLFGGGTLTLEAGSQTASEHFGDQSEAGLGQSQQAALSAASAAAKLLLPASPYPGFSMDAFGTVTAAA